MKQEKNTFEHPEEVVDKWRREYRKLERQRNGYKYTSRVLFIFLLTALTVMIVFMIESASLSMELNEMKKEEVNRPMDSVAVKKEFFEEQYKVHMSNCIEMEKLDHSDYVTLMKMKRKYYNDERNYGKH